MAIARKPNSKPKSPMDEAAADAFIAGAAKPKAEPIATEADEAGQGAAPRKWPAMLRFARALRGQVEAGDKRRGVSPRAWIQFTEIGRRAWTAMEILYVQDSLIPVTY